MVGRTKSGFPKGTSKGFKTKVRSSGHERTVTFGPRRKITPKKK